MPESTATGDQTPPVQGDDKSKGGGDIHNLKSEIDRKLNNFNDQLKSVTDQLRSTLQSLKPQEPPPTQKVNKPLREKFYEDEEATLNEFGDKIKQDIRQEYNLVQRQGEVMARLYQDYPELADPNHALTKRAIEIKNSFSKEEQLNPNSNRLAVLEAAQELDVLPTKKRKTNDVDDWTGGGQGHRPPGDPRHGKDELSDDTLFFAKAMGMNTNDEKVVDSLKARSRRKSWTSYSE